MGKDEGETAGEDEGSESGAEKMWEEGEEMYRRKDATSGPIVVDSVIGVVVVVLVAVSNLM